MERELQRHVPILGWLHVAAGGLFVVVGLFVFTFFTGIGIASGEAEAMRILGIVGLSTGSFLVVLGAPGLVAGYGLLKRRPWSRMMALVLGILNLINIPLGTMMGVYTLWVLLDDRAADYFAEPEYA